MKTEFLQPRFGGARFAEHTLPLEVARDLAAYETLVVELAKHLYLQDHQERQRIPKGFAADFHLHLERVDEGSARPVLAVVAGGVLALGQVEGDYFLRARDLITECIGAPDGQLPVAFPRNLLSYFNQIGRSLRSDERMELERAGASPAVLTPQRRKSLVLAAEKVYEREIELSGTIGEADWERSTFRMRLGDGSSTVVPMPETFHAQAREYGGRARHQVTLRGVGTFDSWDRLQRVVAVELLDVQPDYQLSARFDALVTLEDGWLEGKGVAPNRGRLTEVSERMIGHYPERLPLPIIAPTPEGNLLVEWNVSGQPSLDIDLKAMEGAFHSFLPDDQELEQDFPLSTKEDWNSLFAFLCKNLEA